MLVSARLTGCYVMEASSPESLVISSWLRDDVEEISELALLGAADGTER